MNKSSIVAAQGVSVAFKTTRSENSAADSDRRIVVTGLDSVRRTDFVTKLLTLVSDRTFSVDRKAGIVTVDLPSGSLTKYQFMDKVILALQEAGVKITRD